MSSPIIIRNQGYFSEANSTTTALDGDDVFTGQWKRCDDYATVVFYAESDVSSATNGCVVQTSYDGVNVGSSLSHTLTPSAPVFRIFTAASKYYRVIYTNGSAAQSRFTCYLKFSKSPLRGLSSTRTQSVTKNTDVEFIRTTNDFDFDVVSGRVADHTAVRKFGANTTVSSSEALVWESGSSSPFLSAAATLRIKSGGNVNDTAAGTGARAVTVIFLDSNFNETTEVLATAGASASSATSSTARRLLRAYVSDSGTYTTSGLDGANTGAVVIETSGGTAMGTIAAGIGQTQIAHYTVPAGKTLYIRDVHISAAGTKPASIYMFQRLSADDVTVGVQPRRLVRAWYEVQEPSDHNFHNRISFPAKTDVFFTAKTPSGTSLVNISWNGTLVDD